MWTARRVVPLSLVWPVACAALQLFAMATPEDIKANAMHINTADAFFEARARSLHPPRPRPALTRVPSLQL